MDRLYDFLDISKEQIQQADFLGMLNILIGRSITKSDGTLISNGCSWRELAAALKKARYDKDLVRQLGLDPKELPPRDRLRYWFVAIGQARVDSPQAMKAGDKLAEILRAAGYLVSAAPAAGSQNATASKP